MQRLIAIAIALGLGTASGAQAQDAKPRVADIDWSSADVISVSTGLRDQVPDVDQSLLPVLIPRSFFDYKSFAFVGQPLEYAASARVKGASLAVTGTRIAIDVPGADQAANSAITVVLDQKSVTATVSRYGAAYLVTVECEQASDSRCTSESYVRGLIAGFELIGGGKGAPSTSPAMPVSLGLIGVSADPNFRFDPPGQLAPHSGSGVTSARIYTPNIRFPVQEKPAYLNSQVYGFGGSNGPSSPRNWRDPRNYAYPWRDNFCEIRSRSTPACPSGKGHQGVDIRPANPQDRKHWAVAVEAGKIIKVGTYSITLAGNSGTHYNYLHMEMAQLRVRLGQNVAVGQQLGLISNDFAGTPTPVHLHFEIMQNLNGGGWRHVPPYSSLVAAYKAM